MIDKMRPEDRAHLGKAGRTSEEIAKVVKDRAEKDLHRDIVRYLNVLGIPFCHARMDRRSSMTPGWPDFTFPYKGRFVAWEAKTGTRLSPDQNRIMAQILKAGGEFKVITELGEAKEHLRELDRSINPPPAI
jgi:hypothetical protein